MGTPEFRAKVLEAEAGVVKIYLGSLSRHPLNEDAPPVPLNLYGITKYASELLTQRYGELHGISTASVRLSTPYGPMERVTGHRAVMSVFYQWTGQALRGGPSLDGWLCAGLDSMTCVLGTILVNSFRMSR